MNLIKYLIANIRLAFAAKKAVDARDFMNRVIKSSRAAKDEIDSSYENFLDCCKRQEKAAVMLKRVKRRNTGKPMLNIDLGIEHFFVQPDVSDKITRLDAEVAVTRHRYGDWGEITPYLWRCNNKCAKAHDGIIRSRYPLFSGGYFNVETDKCSGETKICLEGIV